MTFITNFNALFVTTKKNMIKFHIIIIMKRIVCVRLCLGRALSLHRVPVIHLRPKYQK